MIRHDPSEKYDISMDHPEKIKEIEHEMKKHLMDLIPGKDQLAERI
jgi:hypothetical protein